MSDGPCRRTLWREAVEDHPLEAPPPPGQRSKPSSPLVLYAVCMALVRHMDATTLVCCHGDMSTAAIARRAHLQPRAVRYAIGDLERLGIVLVARRRGDALSIMGVMPAEDLSTSPAPDAGEQTFAPACDAGPPRHDVPPSLVVTRSPVETTFSARDSRGPVDERPRPLPPPAEVVAAQRALWPAAVPDVGLPGIAVARAALKGHRPPAPAKVKRGGLRIGARFGTGGPSHRDDHDTRPATPPAREAVP